jgi:hypothetical protein
MYKTTKALGRKMNRRQRRATQFAASKAAAKSAPKIPPSKLKPIRAKKQQKYIGKQFMGLGRRAWAGICALVVVLSLVEAAYQLRPQVQIDIDKSLDLRDPFATRFDVINSGRLSITDLRFDCIINAPPTINNMGLSGSGQQSPTRELPAGQQVVRGCGASAPSFPLNANLTFEVTYNFPLLHRLKTTAHLISQKDAQGVPQWFKSVD